MVPIGKANLVRTGTDVSIITYGMGVNWKQKPLRNIAKLARLTRPADWLPLDTEAIFETVRNR